MRSLLTWVRLLQQAPQDSRCAILSIEQDAIRGEIEFSGNADWNDPSDDLPDDGRLEETRSFHTFC